MVEGPKNFATFSRFPALFLCFILLFTALPARSQLIDDTCAVPEAPPRCEDINPFCVEDHPDMSWAIDQAIAELSADPSIDLLEYYDADGNTIQPNCGPGLIVERAVEILAASGNGGGAGLFAKNYGNQCHGHFVDVIMFPDGCTFDVIVSSGSPGQHGGWMANCCGDPPVQTKGGCPNDRYIGSGGGNEEPGPCGPQDTNRRDFVLSRLLSAQQDGEVTDEEGQSICDDYNATFPGPPTNECSWYPTGSSCDRCIGLVEYYFTDGDVVAGGGEYTPTLRVCDENKPWPSDYYCEGENTSVCSP